MSSDKPPRTERQIWDDLVTELDYELLVHARVRQALGRILYNIKVHLRDHGLDKVRTGRWEALLRERKIEKSTARDWIVEYEIKECIPPHKCFFPNEVARVVKKKEKSHKNRQNNSAGTALLDQAEHAKIECADDRDPDNRDKNGRLAVECVFILTAAEKLEFMKAVGKLGTGVATRIMFEAVVKAAPKRELQEEAVTV